MQKKILIVDDNVNNVRLLTEILEGEGYEVTSMNNGLSVLESTHALKPDLILLDLLMPGLDGFGICKWLQAEPDLRDIPIIMVTAQTDCVEIKRALEIGVFDYIKKPIDQIEVMARVQSAFRLKQHRDRLKEMAMKDSVTGLFNHALLLELFEKEIAQHERDKKAISFAILDIDHFKRINDTYGHQTGDVVLKELANILTRSLRKGDLIGRYGGEEFGIVLPEAPSEGAFKLCDRIRQSIEKMNFSTPKGDIRITVSIGICSKEPDCQTASVEVVNGADEALQRAKQLGRNRVETCKMECKV